MFTSAKSKEWDAQVREFLDTQYATAPSYKSSLLDLWEEYLALGLPNAHFVSEFTSGKKESAFQRAWEMMLARHLDAQGHHLTSPDHGPDFRFEHRGLTVWVEAISPEPKGLPDHWMTFPEPNAPASVHDVPHDQILLRWTAAFKEKCEKLAGYRKDDIVAESDAYVIAISGCQLGKIPLHHGVSRYPYALEAVYPVGPWAYRINSETHRLESPFVTERFTIRNANGSPVNTTPFVDPTYAGVSALVACSMDRSKDATLPLDIIHNHGARVRLPERILGSFGDEWVPDAVGTAGQEVQLRKLEVATQIPAQ